MLNVYVTDHLYDREKGGTFVDKSDQARYDHLYGRERGETFVIKSDQARGDHLYGRERGGAFVVKSDQAIGQVRGLEFEFNGNMCASIFFFLIDLIQENQKKTS